MKRIAFMDLGSNSVRYVVMEIARDLSYQLIYQQKETIRLSEGLYPNNILTEEAIARALQALHSFAHIGEVLAVEKTTAVATAAVRQAQNGQAFMELVHKETGFQLECISGLDEARLGYLGVVNTIALDDFVLFDLGGASTEVTLVKNRLIVESYSFPIGALTLKERFQKGKELTDSEYHAMRTFLKDMFQEKSWLKNTKLPVVGIGGTVRNIGKMDQRRRQYPIPKLHHYEVGLPALHDLASDVRKKSLAQRKKIPGLSTERADIIVPGLTIVESLIEYTKGSGLIVSGNGLREGLFFDFYGKHFLQGQTILPDCLRHSAENYFLNLHCQDTLHTRHVAHIADMLFTQLYRLHEAPPRLRELLYVSAMLHDAGKVINYYSHARHTTYMILNGPLAGLTHREQSMAAFIGGFSHGADLKMPRLFQSAQLLSDEDWQTIRRLSLLLAIAEAVDESHEQEVNFTECHIDASTVTIELHLSSNASLRLVDSFLPKLQKQFKKDFQRNLKFVEVRHEPSL